MLYYFFIYPILIYIVMCCILLDIKKVSFEVRENFEVALDGGGTRHMTIMLNRYVSDKKEKDLEEDYILLEVCKYY